MAKNIKTKRVVLNIVNLESFVDEFKIVTRTSAKSILSSYWTISEVLVKKDRMAGVNDEYIEVYYSKPYHSLRDALDGHQRLLNEVQRNPRKYGLKSKR